MSSPAERGDKVRRDLKRAYARVTVTDRRADYADVLLPPGSLVFHTRTEIVEWLRAEGLVVLDKQQTETVRRVLRRGSMISSVRNSAEDEVEAAAILGVEGADKHLRWLRAGQPPWDSFESAGEGP